MFKVIGYAALTFTMLFVGMSVGNDLLSATIKPKTS